MTNTDKHAVYHKTLGSALDEIDLEIKSITRPRISWMHAVIYRMDDGTYELTAYRA